METSNALDSRLEKIRELFDNSFKPRIHLI